MNLIQPNGLILRVICLLACMSLTARPHVSWSRDDNQQELKLNWKAVKKLVAVHPALEGATHNINAANGMVLTAGTGENPELEGTVGYGMARDGDEKRVEWGVSLSIPLDWIARRSARRDAAMAGLKTAEQEKIALQRDIVLELRVLFLELLFNQERVRVFETLARETGRLSEMVASRVQNGESRNVEAVQMRVEAEKISADLVLARAALQISRDRLGVWLAGKPGTAIVAEGDIAALPTVPSLDNRHIESTIAQHPAYRVAEAEIAGAAASATREEKEKIPDIAISPFFDSELDRRAVGVGVSVSLPLMNRNRGSIEAAYSRYKSKQASLETVKRELHATLLEYRTSCTAARNVAALYQNVILPDAETAANTIRRTYELGEATLFEAISATRMRIEVQLQLVDALESAQQSCIRFNDAAGKEL